MKFFRNWFSSPSQTTFLRACTHIGMLSESTDPQRILYLLPFTQSSNTWKISTATWGYCLFTTIQNNLTHEVDWKTKVQCSSTGYLTFSQAVPWDARLVVLNIPSILYTLGYTPKYQKNLLWRKRTTLPSLVVSQTRELILGKSTIVQGDAQRTMYCSTSAKELFVDFRKKEAKTHHPHRPPSHITTLVK